MTYIPAVSAKNDLRRLMRPQPVTQVKMVIGERFKPVHGAVRRTFMKIEVDDPSHVALIKAALVSNASTLKNIDRRAGGRPVWNETVAVLLAAADAVRYVAPFIDCEFVCEGSTEFLDPDNPHDIPDFLRARR